MQFDRALLLSIAIFLHSSFEGSLPRNNFFVFIKSMTYKYVKIQKIVSNSGCFLITTCHARGAYFAQDERRKMAINGLLTYSFPHKANNLST
jgi:hypothetical protein